MASLNNIADRVKSLEDNTLFAIQEINKNITISAGAWASTGIKLGTGTFIVQMYFSSAHSGGGAQYNEYYSGIMSFYDGGTNSDIITEIPLTNAGHAPNNRFCTLGFKRVSGNTGLQELVISANESVDNCPVTFKFRRVL